MKKVELRRWVIWVSSPLYLLLLFGAIDGIARIIILPITLVYLLYGLSLLEEYLKKRQSESD